MGSDRVLDDIKSRIDIVEFISDYVQLKKSGQNWKGLCPFHAEKTPSFMVNETKQIFHCFGCGAGGDVISFVLQFEKLSFNEAVTFLARKAGVCLPVSRAEKKVYDRNEQIRKALSEAKKYFRQRIKESAKASDYIMSRGINSDSLEHFEIGYAPPGWGDLVKHLKQAGYSEEVIKGSGLGVSGARGMYDMFRDRIVFPIMSVQGNVIGFGGRALGDLQPKYINSPETTVFKKSDTLYGHFTAKEEIRQKGFVLLVEGYLDVIVCHQYGFQNTVAPLGTALTTGHLRKLRKQTDKAIVVFDGDNAGVAAAMRALPLLCNHDFKTKVLLIPENEDPDSYLIKYGSDSFRALVEKAKSVVEFVFSVSHDKGTDLVRSTMAVIAENSDPLVAEEMLIELSGKTRINEQTLRQEFAKIKRKSRPSREDVFHPGTAAMNAEENLLLSAVISFPDRLDAVLSRLNMNDIGNRDIGSLFKKLALVADRQDFSVVLNDCNEEERKLFTKLSVAPGFDREHVDRVVEDCFRRIEEKKFSEKLYRAQLAGDLRLFNSLLLEKKKLIKEAGL